MNCNDITACFGEINAYCSGAFMGHALLVNTENYDCYQSILTQIKADSSKKIVHVSDNCYGNALPKIDEICAKVTGAGCYVLVGVSQFTLLRGQSDIKKCILNLLQMPVRGHAVILLEHCQQYLNYYLKQDPRIDRRIVIVNGDKSLIPQICLAKKREVCIGHQPIANFHDLLVSLEKLTNQILEKNPIIYAITPFSANLFLNSIYSVSTCDSIYKMLTKLYSDIAAGTMESYGTEGQWCDLAKKMEKHHTFSGVITSIFGSVVNLASYIRDAIESADKLKLWYLWMGMKILGVSGHPYLVQAVSNSKTVDELEEYIYMDLLSSSHTNESFCDLYFERKRLIDAFPENITMVDLYCSRVGKYEKNAIYYLTDVTDKEKYEFMRCMCMYEYTEKEVIQATAITFPEIYSYLQNFKFSASNLKLADQDVKLRERFTEYFNKYKLQKVTNEIQVDFIAEIEANATERPYNRVQSRISILKKKVTPTSQIFFFDALGVEYLSYIQAKCEKYGLISEIQVARCELPSITEKNKEFMAVYPGTVLKIEELDELKHHSQVIDYQKCKEPIHLFRELEIIDNQLRKIQSNIMQGYYDSAIIVSDHGASRLAVIYEHENNSILQLDEKAEHSGRCCVSESDPHIPFAAYEDGYSILANYERFKGGRKANVEVHGGASLEEVLVPIVFLSRRPEELEICFINSLIEIKPKENAAITVFSNIPLSEPYLHVNEVIYKGESMGDSRHIKFVMPELKRSRNCVADVYDGDRKLASELPFRVQTTVAKANDRMSI